MKNTQMRVHGEQAARGQRENVRFELSAEPGSRVFVAGTFNAWNPEANPLMFDPGRGHFEACLHVPAGTYEYKFIVNGVWSEDPKCAERVPNECGTMNSVLHV